MDDGDEDGDGSTVKVTARDKRKYSNGPAMAAVPFSAAARRSMVAPYPAAENKQPIVASEFASMFQRSALRHAVREQVRDIISALDRQQEEEHHHRQLQQQKDHNNRPAVPPDAQRELSLRFGDALINDFGEFIEECVV
ncbi:hypothetical protein HDU87_006804 [Geranomyces variabilis]|uniref:Uncharacterized protein n=1 Tax=Geranomyces variabilis TaxID=109894 RepID=A0AAD5XQ21_9FUNG|nr:hypothetical protein HDU87_006804 [Geranomyces variabilis]